MSEVEAVIDAESLARAALHADHATSRPLSEGYEKVGFVGEVVFAREFNLPLDWRRRAGGDGGFDFTVPVRHTVDVKTVRKAHNLLQEQGKISADICVLAQYLTDEEADAQLVGWEWGKVLARAPVRDFGHGILNHFIARGDLRPMAQLAARIMRLA